MKNDFSVNKKLELLEQIRSRYTRDRYDMSRRERILYDDTYDDGEEEFSTFPLRLFLAAAAFVLIILSDKTDSSIFGLSAEKCFYAISTDYESSIAAWTNAASNAITNINTNDDGYDDRPLKDNPPAGLRP